MKNGSKDLGAAQKQNNTVYVIEVQPQRTYEEVGGKKNISRMGIAFAALLDHHNNTISVYSEPEINACLDALVSAQRVVGYHLEKFVFPLFAGYRDLDVHRFDRLDILDYLSKKIGRRAELDELLFGTLEIKWSTDPMKMARLFQQGQIELVKQATVQMAKHLGAIYRCGEEKGYVFINGPFGQRWKISVEW